MRMLKRLLVCSILVFGSLTVYGADDDIILFRPFGAPCDPAGKVIAAKFISKGKVICNLINHYANVTALSLSSREFAPGDDLISNIATEIYDPEGDVVTFNYLVSAGKIIGQGSKVRWDLSGVSPGTYTISAGANDGFGVCGNIQTRRVEILECNGCTIRETE